MFPFSFFSSNTVSPLAIQAEAHYDRVIADGGTLPAGLLGCIAFFEAVGGVYGATDITTVLSAAYDPHYLGYKAGAGSGTTLGQAASKLYSACGIDGDLFQGTAASQPLLLPHTGDNYFFSPLVNNNYLLSTNVSCGTSSGCQVDIKVSFNESLSTINGTGWLVSHDNGSSNRNLFIGFLTFRTLVIYWANLSRSATATQLLPSTFNGWIRVKLENNGANMDVKYFTSTDGISWTQLGATVTNVGGANTYQTGAAPFNVTGNGGANTTKGNFFRVIYRDANGNLIADMNPASYNASASQTQWTSATGEVWTINTGTATTGYKSVLVDRTVVQGDGIDDEMATGTLPNIQFDSVFLVINPLNIPSSGGAYYFDGKGANSLIYGNTDGLIAFNGADLNFIGELEYRLQYCQADFNGATSNLFRNNSNQVSGNTGSRIGSGNSLFSNGSGGAFGNAIITTAIRSVSVVNSTQRTAMYNAIRGFNNNAF